MPTTLNLFPSRVPIGTVMDATGKTRDVMMTQEFSRALSDLMTRLGGTKNYSTDELALLTTASTTEGAAIAGLLQQVADLSTRLAAANDMNARLASIARQLEQVAQLAHLAGPVPVDWEHPGKIGAAAPNVATFTSVNKVKITAPAGTATLTLADGKTFKVNNSVTLAGTDGTTMTFPATSATIARTDAAQTFGGSQTFSNSDNAFGVGIGTAQLHMNGGTGFGSGPRIRFERGSANKGSIGIDSSVIGSDSDDITIYSPASNVNFWAGGLPVARADGNGISTKGGAVLMATFNGLTNYEAGNAATLTNSPRAGNPTRWVAINDNGTTRYLPLW